ncbi:MAG: AI-2E family transporter [Gammaproteobacteria bacterium]|nr:AI-2E family transporter [Gammaproteobacteria bacterium]MCW9032351.1 AI-2E family transporter [Gammaproteobacteria bacterium]
MIELIKKWYKQYFSDPQAIILTAVLVIGSTIILTMGDMLLPVFASIVIAYLLEGVVRRMERTGSKRITAVILVFSIFVAFLIFLFFGVAPSVSNQLSDLFKELPRYLRQGQQLLLQLPEIYPFISEEQVKELIDLINREITGLGSQIVSLSFSSIPGLITLAVYIFLVPVLVFLFMKDKERIWNWFGSLLPSDRRLVSQVSDEMDLQLGKYIRGKFFEIMVVGIVTYIGFSILGLKYSLLLSVLVGLSVLVPYIGAAVVTIPVVLIAFFQWGWTNEFFWIIGFFGISQALDGTVLVPWLFSGLVNLHPIAIIISVLVFGGLWGFWGVFFAIPLATLVSAVIHAWPRIDVAAEKVNV